MKVGSYYWLDTSSVVNISIRLAGSLSRNSRGTEDVLGDVDALRGLSARLHIWRATLSGSTQTGGARLGRLKPCLTAEREGNNGIISQMK